MYEYHHKTQTIRTFLLIVSALEQKTRKQKITTILKTIKPPAAKQTNQKATNKAQTKRIHLLTLSIKFYPSGTTPLQNTTIEPKKKEHPKPTKFLSG